ncbi:MAG: MBL fold metallo-hydrolase [Lentisphaerae bacterium]|jgi:hydroxyacylglutathione hydrolase|nr:MBL fold metallo-hydrolase [Lentisphaerota bacterium]MBT4816612.1 MBL fold metallo-hydrolase [Lentisphaerota bacterium]MBT5610940.1 MBL fold metallo-hydrolase [Lentisphaerota bacterium]MBT7053648.1 MBL fold metallo-hydrolase [Lentisphaerota bacterium]MBT7842027.1 MBL fold metallo-hydrolase [Lentisphaerota bacterium]
MSVQIRTFPVGMLQVNCYVVWAPPSTAAAVIDPGDDAEEILAFLEQESLTAAAVLLTHAHVDHIGGVPGIARATGVPVYVHAEDVPLYTSPENALPPWVPAAVGLPKPVTAPPTIEGLTFDVLHTPGHTPGGVCFYFADDDLLISGDTLFAGSIGRTDLPGGDMATLMGSLQRVIADVPTDTVVYPGHGPTTTIGRERASNPYITMRVDRS